MASASTKLKIILVVFAVLVGLFLIQFLVSSVKSVKARESFKDGFEDETPNDNVDSKKEKEKNKDSGKEEKERKQDKDIKFQILEQVENIFAKKYTDSTEEKPAIFGMLMENKTFQELKEKYNNGQPIGKYVENFIAKVIGESEEDTTDDQENVDQENVDEEEVPKPVPKKTTKTSLEDTSDPEEKVKDTKNDNEVTDKKTKNKLNVEKQNIQDDEEDEDRGINYALKKITDREKEEKLMTRLEEIKKEMSRIQNELDKIQQSQLALLSNANSNGKKKTQKEATTDLIEGFENRINYASYF